MSATLNLAQLEALIPILQEDDAVVPGNPILIREEKVLDSLTVVSYTKALGHLGYSIRRHLVMDLNGNVVREYTV